MVQGCNVASSHARRFSCGSVNSRNIVFCCIEKYHISCTLSCAGFSLKRYTHINKHIVNMFLARNGLVLIPLVIFLRYFEMFLAFVMKGEELQDFVFAK